MPTKVLPPGIRVQTEWLNDRDNRIFRRGQILRFHRYPGFWLLNHIEFNDHEKTWYGDRPSLMCTKLIDEPDRPAPSTEDVKYKGSPAKRAVRRMSTWMVKEIVDSASMDTIIQQHIARHWVMWQALLTEVQRIADGDLAVPAVPEEAPPPPEVPVVTMNTDVWKQWAANTQTIYFNGITNTATTSAVTTSTSGVYTING